jgi:hypothetical protein
MNTFGIYIKVTAYGVPAFLIILGWIFVFTSIVSSKLVGSGYTLLGVGILIYFIEGLLFKFLGIKAQNHFELWFHFNCW